MKNKLVLIALILLFSVSAAFTQNGGMSYQAVIRDNTGQLVTNQSVAATIKVRIGATDIFNQTYQVNTNAHGLLTINFANPVFKSINWENATISCEVRQGSSVYLAENFQPVVAVPLSFYATSMNRDTLHSYLNSDSHILDIRHYMEQNRQYIIYNDMIIHQALEDTAANIRQDLAILDSAIRSALIDTAADIRIALSDTAVDIRTDMVTMDNLLRSDLDDSTAALRNALSDTATAIRTYISTLETDTQNLNDVLIRNNSAENQNIINLANPVNLQDAATKAYVDALLARINALEEIIMPHYGFTDLRDGNHYNVVQIGDQLWMAENLKYLPSVVGLGTYSKTIPYYYVYGYDGTDVSAAKATVNYTTYGVLYNGAAAMVGDIRSNANPSGVQGVCPDGWHLPSDAEWIQLYDYVGGIDVAGGKLKDTTSYWNSPNIGATNESGFTALPGGYFYYTAFYDIGIGGVWWSCTADEYSPDFFWGPYLGNNIANVFWRTNGMEMGFSVRCVKD